ncbi:purine nucleoside phosphorylase, putative [Trichomonas vaginalis G3]|uniref:Purine nucleoside phosphorylase, putative n=1 Tax=Trichomonas vaginalis (strain ATCC PRA-98 / G3) TaxID=412133 RepID=A2DZL6_TRIV3|nr:uridine phosphorylase family [Trichomonas vaginalis G3]EAY14084.1 purine nucleoside phosphorylase, putative [Trichomonas vaginalis G3]KAI5525094.1 uridine phosphorylase family [Trichomonas vaginalis G3]|eukprot:XP_001326307.1 purine nucleoside phosphorylase [Trichomonas vaginalis G3]
MTLQHPDSCKGGNTIPVDKDGRPYHFGANKDEVSNEFLITSDYYLAEQISKLFEEKEPFCFRSNRGYTTFTGHYKGKRLSICAFGIGFAMIDFLVREVRTITKGKLTFIALGAAPSPAGHALGTAINIKDAVAYELDFNTFNAENPTPYRFFKKPVPADETLFNALNEGLKAANIPHVEGRVASNPSFISGVNSADINGFNFKKEGLLQKVEAELGKIDTLEMDTYPLYWTALREVNHDIKTAAISIVNSDANGHALPVEELRKRQVEVAAVILEQLGKLQ